MTILNILRNLGNRKIFKVFAFLSIIPPQPPVAKKNLKIGGFSLLFTNNYASIALHKCMKIIRKHDRCPTNIGFVF